jgi:hypothetical protein
MPLMLARNNGPFVRPLVDQLIPCSHATTLRENGSITLRPNPEKKRRMGPHAGVDYNLTLSHSRLRSPVFHPNEGECR